MSDQDRARNCHNGFLFVRPAMREVKMSPLLPRLNLLVLRSLDMPTAVSFYQLLGLKFKPEKHGTGPEHYSSQIGDVVLEIYPAGAVTDVDRTTRLGFEVQELDEIVGILRANGHRVFSRTQSFSLGLRSVIIDPDGRSVELLQTDS